MCTSHSLRARMPTATEQRRVCVCVCARERGTGLCIFITTVQEACALKNRNFHKIKVELNSIWDAAADAVAATVYHSAVASDAVSFRPLIFRLDSNREKYVASNFHFVFDRRVPKSTRTHFPPPPPIATAIVHHSNGTHNE